VTNLEPIVTTEIKPTIVHKEGLTTLHKDELSLIHSRYGLLEKDIEFREGRMYSRLDGKEIFLKEGLANPEYEAGLHEKKSLGTKIKELFTGPADQKIE